MIKSPISEELEDFKKLFESTLSSSNLLLNSVIAHIRQKNGKMMRPILVLLAAKLFGKVCPATLHAAVALELLHNASLVHDDVVDESTERRGQLSVNAIFNNKVAVLAGDYLLATALVQVGMTRNHDISTSSPAWGRIWQMVNFCSFPTSAISISPRKSISTLSARRRPCSLQLVRRRALSRWEPAMKGGICASVR